MKMGVLYRERCLCVTLPSIRRQLLSDLCPDGQLQRNVFLINEIVI